MKSKLLDRKIYFRVFPTETMVWDYVKILDDYKTIYIRCLQELSKSQDCIRPTFWTFQTDRVFYNETQQQIYNCIITDVLSNLSQGLDAIIVAYGQTGTGKSLTVSGLHNSYDDRGVLPRVISELFEMKSTISVKDDKKMCIQISFIEISKTVVHDLLKPYPNSVNSIKDVAKIKVKCEDDALKYIFKGEGRKEYSEELPYPSHSFTSICTFYITIKDSRMQDNEKQHCKLHIIDFAGADTVGNFSCLLKKPCEVGSANLAKTQLEQFLLALSNNIPQQIKVKYRLNPIIQYLGDSLNCSSLLRFIGHIKVSREDLFITISMLRFGQLVGGIKITKHEINIASKDINSEKVHKLKNELTKLICDQQYDSLLTSQNLSVSFNADRFAHVQRIVNEYLEDKITELTVLNVCEINIALEILKMMCKNYEEEKNKRQSIIVLKGKSSKGSLDKSHQHTKPSKSSNKSSSSNSLLKKIPEEKFRTPSRSLSAPLKASKQASTTQMTSSGSNLRPLTGKKTSQHSQSSLLKERRSKTEGLTMPSEVPPEYNEAWEVYKTEKKDTYDHLQSLYQKNEVEMKSAYKTYMDEMERLREITMTIDKIKSELVMAQMTRQLQSTERHRDAPSELEQCLIEEMRKAEREKIEKREIVLTSQALFKISLDVCKQIKYDLKDSFEHYCRDKYHMPLIESPRDEILMKIEDFFQETENDVNELLPDNSQMEKYNRFKQLIAAEQRKKKNYQLKHTEWTFY